MRNTLAIARRELDAYLSTPIGWIVLCAFVVWNGVFFLVFLFQYQDYASQAVFNPYMADQLNVNDGIVVPFYGNMAVISLLAAPALAMRLIAEDRRTRAIELLLTSPVRSGEIVLGKFFGAMGFSGILGLTTLLYAAILMWLGEPDPAIIAANFAGYLLMFGVFMATGLFFSSLTENQVVALVLAFGFNLMIWIVGWMGGLLPEGGVKTSIEYISMLTHIEKLGTGVVHLEGIVYFLTFIGFFLLAATLRVEALRWR